MIPIVIPVGGSNSTKLSNMPLGILLRVTEDGVNVNYELAGFDAYGANTATFVRKDIYGTSTRTQHYADSAIDTLCNTTIFGKFPASLQSKILEVTLTLATGVSTSTTINRKCFLPTRTNMGFGDNNSTTEGTALGLYTADSYRIKKNAGTAAIWWLSSWVSATYARTVTAAGAISQSTLGTARGVVPAFVLSSNEQVQFPPNDDGSYSLAGTATGGGGATAYAISCNETNPQSFLYTQHGVAGDRIVTYHPDYSFMYFNMTIKDASNNTISYTARDPDCWYFTMPASDVTITVDYA